MQKSSKFYTYEGMKGRMLSPKENLHFGYSPGTTPQRRLGVISRKSSMVDLTKEVNKVKRGTPRLQSQRILQIVKEAQIETQQSKPKELERKQQGRLETVEGLNFTFAQNFSNRQILLKEFSAQSLRKKFFI